ncbi:MAG: hypothetical protein AMXMBFR83_10220 [Phycisphaerae bacterium]
MATAGVLAAGAAGGCGGGTPLVNAILDSQIVSQGGTLTTNTSRIQIINTTQTDIELDVLVDELAVTIECTAAERRCAYTPPLCPLTVKTVQERRLNALGIFVGGRNYNDNPAFTFESTEFDCQSVIVFTFTEDSTTVDVL